MRYPDITDDGRAITPFLADCGHHIRQGRKVVEFIGWSAGAPVVTCRACGRRWRNDPEWEIQDVIARRGE